MNLHHVSRWRWADALEEFSRAHRGWLANLVTVGPGPMLLSYTEWRPLEFLRIPFLVQGTTSTPQFVPDVSGLGLEMLKQQAGTDE